MVEFMAVIEVDGVAQGRISRTFASIENATAFLDELCGRTNVRILKWSMGGVREPISVQVDRDMWRIRENHNKLQRKCSEQNA